MRKLFSPVSYLRERFLQKLAYKAGKKDGKEIGYKIAITHLEELLGAFERNYKNSENSRELAAQMKHFLRDAVYEKSIERLRYGYHSDLWRKL